MAVEDTSPAREAYLASHEEGYKGRFVSNIANVRLFKSNPYIKDEDEATLSELNQKLLKPYDGEQFYDDDGYIYLCKYVKNNVTGAVEYEYISKGKDTNDKLKYYESQGVLNQLMSAYNNGRVYKFFVDRANLMAYPNTSLVFPENYVSYDIREQKLTETGDPIYVAGDLNSVTDAFKMAMKPVTDTVKGTIYHRMCPAKLFANEVANRDSSVGTMNNGEFYVVNFYNADDIIIDTKLFQAVDSAMVKTAMPSQSVVDLRVSVLRNNLPETSANDMYPILAGEDIDKTVSCIVSAVYNDGTIKVITDKKDTPNLVVTGLKSTANGTIGSQYPVTFTYYPNVDNEGKPISSGISKTITFQIVANASEVLYKIIPVMWSDNATDFVIKSPSSKKVYKLKVYSLSTAGVLENKTRSFYDTMQYVNEDKLDIFEAGSGKNCAGLYYDPYNQCVVFTFVEGNVGKETTFNFKLYNESVSTNYRFVARFGSSDTDKNSYYIMPLKRVSNYGYEPGGPLSTLQYTYMPQNDGSDENTILQNKILKNMVDNGNGFNFSITSNTNGGTDSPSFSSRYARYIDNTLVRPNAIQIIAVRDETCTSLTPITQIPEGSTEINLVAYKENTVISIINHCVQNGDYVLAKFMYGDLKENKPLKLVNYDVFIVNDNGLVS